MSDILLAPRLWSATPAAELLRDSVRYELPKRYSRLFDRLLLMAGGKTDYLEAAVKNEVLGAAAFTAPTNVYFGLWGTAATLSDTSTSATAGEVSGGSYARVNMTNNLTNFPSVTTAAKVNNVAITFPTASANWNSGATINQVGVNDVTSGAGNMLLWSDLTTAKTVLNGDTAQFAISAFSWQED